MKIEEIMKEEKLTLTFDHENEDRFLEFLNYLDATDEWKKVSLPSLQLKTIPEGVVSTNLALVVETKEYPIIPEALYSIKKRALDEAEILKRMVPEDIATHINLSWKYLTKKSEDGRVGKCLIRGSNLLGLLSSRYVPFSQSSLYGSLAFYLKRAYEKVNFERAVYKHTLTEGRYRVYNKELIEGYTKALNGAGYSISTDDLRISVCLRTSDAGLSAISIYPLLSISEGIYVPFSEPLKIQHKDSSEFADVEASFNKIFSLIESAVEHMESLLEIELRNPSSVAKKIAKKYANIPSKAVAELLPTFEYYEACGETIDAHRFYLNICGVMNTQTYKDANEKRKLDIQDALSKILCMTKKEWKQMDKAGE